LVEDSKIVLKKIVRKINKIGKEIDNGLYKGNEDKNNWVEEW